MKLSVIVPVYKVEKYIRQCVDSILGQTYQNMEVLLINDGSPDGSPEICEEYAQKDARVKVLHKQNEGLAAAVTDGIKMSSGELIGFVDSDDWVEHNMFETLVSLMCEEESDISICGIIKEHGDISQEMKEGIPDGLYTKMDINEKIINHLIYERVIVPARWNKVFRRKLLVDNIDATDNNISYGEDMMRTIPAILDAENISVIGSKCLYHYRVNQDSICNSYQPQKLERAFLLYYVLKKTLAQKKRLDLLNDLKLDFCMHIRHGLKNTILKGENIRNTIPKISTTMNDVLVHESAVLLAKKKTGFGIGLANWLIMNRYATIYYLVVKLKLIFESNRKMH